MNYDKIGKFITTLRKSKGLTQKDLANHLNITDRAVSKWERGKGCPDVSLLEELSKILDVSIIELLKGEKINSKLKLEKEELLYSMNYVNNNAKEKISKIINIVIVTLIAVIILIILFNNLKISILLNYHYYPNIMIINDKNIFEELENNINLIKNENINYSKEELNEIISIIGKYIDEEKNIYNKEYYTYNDIKKVIYRNDLDGVNEILKLSINKMSYNGINWNNDIDYIASGYYRNKNVIKEFINNCYKYNYRHNSEENIGNNVKNLIYDKYYIYYLILEDIINGGEVNE